jgi:hypothetical protein
MDPIEKLCSSAAWDHRDYHLPLIRTHNNPHLYCAYAARLLGEHAGALDAAYENYLGLCEAPKGYIRRYPAGERASHDELLGAAYLSQEFALRAVQFLSSRQGYWTDSGKPARRDNIRRFIFLMPYLKSRAGIRVGLLSLILFSLHVLYSAFFVKPGEVSGLLKIWLMAEEMKKYGLCRTTLRLWGRRWTRRGFTPKKIFTEIYLKEIPELGEMAEDSWGQGISRFKPGT